MSASATEIRDLRTGAPVWASYGAPPLLQRSTLANCTTDVVIVGAGITGAFVAEAASAAGLQVLILDRRSPAQGSTAASTALLQFEIDTPLVHLAEQIGLAKASRAWQRSYRAVHDLGQLVRSLEIACAHRSRSALYLAGNLLGARAIADEGRLRRSIGLPSSFLSAGELEAYAGIDRPAALLSQGAADVDPVRLTAGLLRRAAQRGANVVWPAEVADIAPGSKHVELVTDGGVEVRAAALVFATGYELPKGVPSRGHQWSSTWAFATRPQPENLWSGGDLIWEASDPYLYIRTTSDGRLIVGGEDEEFDEAAKRDALTSTKIPTLQRKAKQLLPFIDVAADFAWAGTFGESETGLPSIGAVPGMANCHAVLGYGGNGITFSVIAAQIIVDLMRGKRDADADLFAFE